MFTYPPMVWVLIGAMFGEVLLALFVNTPSTEKRDPLQLIVIGMTMRLTILTAMLSIGLGLLVQQQ